MKGQTDKTWYDIAVSFILVVIIIYSIIGIFLFAEAWKLLQ